MDFFAFLLPYNDNDPDKGESPFRRLKDKDVFPRKPFDDAVGYEYQDNTKNLQGKEQPEGKLHPDKMEQFRERLRLPEEKKEDLRLPGEEKEDEFGILPE